MFFLCLFQFPLGDLVYFHSPKTYRFRANRNSYLPVDLNVTVFYVC